MQQALYYLSYAFLVFFLYKFIRERKLFQLMFVIWSVTVILSNFIKDSNILMAIGIIQFALMIIILFLLSKGRKDAQNEYMKAAAEYEEYGTVNGVVVKPPCEETDDNSEFDNDTSNTAFESDDSDSDFESDDD